MLKKISGKVLRNKSRVESLVTEHVGKQSVQVKSTKEMVKNSITLDFIVAAVLITFLQKSFQGTQIALGNRLGTKQD